MKSRSRRPLWIAIAGVLATIAGPVAPASAAPPAITAFNPLNTATNVALNANIVLTFGENVTAQAGRNIAISTMGSPDVTIPVTCTDSSADGCNGNQVTVTGAAVTSNPAANLTCGKLYGISLQNGAFKNGGNED